MIFKIKSAANLSINDKNKPQKTVPDLTLRDRFVKFIKFLLLDCKLFKLILI